MAETSGKKETELSQVKFVICDWDGTLVDSMPAKTECFLRVMEEVGGDPDRLREYYLSSAGEALTLQIKKAARHFAGREIKDTTDLEARFEEYYAQAGKIEVLRGAEEALAQLKQKGYTVVVWSGSRTDVLGDKLVQTGLGKFVDFYIGNVPGDDKLLKGPGLFGEIARHFGISVKDLQKASVVVGDGSGDIEAGRKSGVKTVGLGANRARLKEAGADFVIEDISKLPDLFEHGI